LLLSLAALLRTAGRCLLGSLLRGGGNRLRDGDLGRHLRVGRRSIVGRLAFDKVGKALLLALLLVFAHQTHQTTDGLAAFVIGRGVTAIAGSSGISGTSGTSGISRRI
jgi:hypothetical protein